MNYVNAVHTKTSQKLYAELWKKSVDKLVVAYSYITWLILSSNNRSFYSTVESDRSNRIESSCFTVNRRALSGCRQFDLSYVVKLYHLIQTVMFTGSTGWNCLQRGWAALRAFCLFTHTFAGHCCQFLRIKISLAKNVGNSWAESVLEMIDGPDPSVCRAIQQLGLLIVTVSNCHKIARVGGVTWDQKGVRYGDSMYTPRTLPHRESVK